MLYMFRTILVHLQEQLYKLYITFGICRYMPATQQPDIWYRHIYIIRIIKRDLRVVSKFCGASGLGLNIMPTRRTADHSVVLIY